MKKILLLILSIKSAAFASIHESCLEYKDHKSAFSISKNINPLNILHFGISLNRQTCEFEGETESPIVIPYWVMGHKTIDQKVTCEAITKKEVSSLIGYGSHNEMFEKLTRKVNSQTIEINIPMLKKLGAKISHNTILSEILTVKAIRNDNDCIIQTSGVMNSEDFLFDQLYVYIRFFSIRTVNIYRNEESVLD